MAVRDLVGLEPRQRQVQPDDLPDRRFIFDDQRSPGGVCWRGHAGNYRQQSVIALPKIPNIQVTH
jgi:hypothetical protein